jgi:hypothetical protein
MNLANLAAQRRAAPLACAPLERLWLLAALDTLAEGMPITPDLAALQALTQAPEQVWADLRVGDPQALTERFDSLVNCQHLAITLAEHTWLEQLDQCWAAAPAWIEPGWPLRARGEIALALPDRDKQRWSADDIEYLIEESILAASAPADQAWLALHHGDKPAALLAIDAHGRLLEQTMQRWQADPERGLRHAMAYPGAVLGCEWRALQRLARR